MARYIDADKLIDELRVDLARTTVDAFTIGIVETTITLLREYPTADVAEVKHGEWIGKPLAGYAKIRCSVCNTAFVQETGTWAYCPECGAKMDGGKI